MEAKKILQADFLDLLFDGRNKKYGAYALRKNYSRRMWTAVVVTLLISFSGFFLLKQGRAKNVVPRLETREIVLSSIEVIKTPPLPPPEKQATKKSAKAITPGTTKPAIVSSEIKRTKFTTPIVVKDNVSSEPIHILDENVLIDDINVDGVVGHQILAPASSTVDVFETGIGSGTAEVLTKPKEDNNEVFEKVEIQASVNFVRWRQHLEQNLVSYINDAADVGMQPGTHTVMVRFIVEKDGSIKDAWALNDPGFGLAQAATKVIKSGPKWNPGEQNGLKVRSYHTQPITFVMMDS